MRPQRPVRFQNSTKDVLATAPDTDDNDLESSDVKEKLKAAMQVTKKGKTASLAMLNASTKSK